MFGYLFLALVLVAVATFVLGSRRARAVVQGKHGVLHSLPGYHGGWLALMAAGPAFLVLCIWSIIVPRLERVSIFGSLGAPAQDLPLAQQDALWRDIRAIVEGGTVAQRDALRDQGAQLYRSLATTADIVLTVLLAAMVVGLAYVAWKRIAPAFRARHVVERVTHVTLALCAAIAILTTIGIVLSLSSESLRFFTLVNPLDFLTGFTWTPQQMAFRADQVGGNAAFGFIPLLTGTLLITTIAISVAAPLGLLCAIYLSDYASPQVRAIGKPVLEILAGIPTVVYGFFAALTMAPFIRRVGEQLQLDVSSESALAAGLVMGIMIVPFVSSLSDDVINAVPQSLRDGSAGLGATKSETMKNVVLPAALPGIVSALILAISRAIGETMIVVMAAGLAANLTFNPLAAVTTITVQIGTLLVGDQEFDSPKTLAAFGLGLVLFVFTLLLNLIALRVVKKYREQYD
jgi:phosphate transport system permease protein